MAADRLSASSNAGLTQHQTPKRFNGSSKMDAESTSPSSSVSSSSLGARHIRQHRNSWPTHEESAAAVARAIKPKLLQLSTTTEEDCQNDDSDSEGSASDNGAEQQRPTPSRQRRLVSRCETHNDGGTHTYAVAKVWYRRWEEHVGAARGFVAGESPTPGPVEMDTSSDDGNLFVEESVWKLLVAWYSVASSHHLDRRHLYFKDEKVFDVCVLSPFSGIVEHRCKRFNRFEEVGYVELQLRRMFSVSPTSRRSRLWISEKTPVPRFRQLLFRLRMLNDCIHRDKTYILALELADVSRDAAAPTAAWPTGEPGDARGELSRYDKLTGADIDDLDSWNDSVRQGLADLERTVSGQVALAVAQFNEAARSTLVDATLRLDERRRDAEDRLRALDSRVAELEAIEKSVFDREEAIAAERSSLDDERRRLDDDEASLREAKARIDELTRSSGDSKVRLDVGGSIYTTSTQTLRRYPNSLLALMFSGRCDMQPESDGSYFIDRDGSYFRHILNFMRDGTLDPETLPKDRSSISQIICEARYYQLDQLVDHLAGLLRTSSPQ